MTELRFHRDIYAGEAVDEAAKMFRRFATLELVEEPTHWVVRLTARDPSKERRIAGELGNYALGRSGERRGARR